MRRFLAVLTFAALAGGAQAQKAPRDYDLDHDGKVTLAEYKQVQGDATGRAFDRLDTDKDGRITQAEITAAQAAAPNTAARSGGGRMQMILDRDKDHAISRADMDGRTDRRFARADTDNDGWLSTGELLMMQQKPGRAAN